VVAVMKIKGVLAVVAIWAWILAPLYLPASLALTVQLGPFVLAAAVGLSCVVYKFATE